MLRVVAAQHDPLRSRIHGLIHHAAFGRRKNLRLKECQAYRLIPGEGPGIVFGQPYRGADRAHRVIVRIRIQDYVIAPEIDSVRWDLVGRHVDALPDLLDAHCSSNALDRSMSAISAVTKPLSAAISLTPP